MKRRVEARDRGYARQLSADELERPERLRLVERREICDRLEAPQDGLVDDDGLDELRPAVNDAVADGVDSLERVEIDVRVHHVVPVENRELEAARPRVDDEDARASVLPGDSQCAPGGWRYPMRVTRGPAPTTNPRSDIYIGCIRRLRAGNLRTARW